MREEYIEELKAFLQDERLAGLAATKWHNPRSGTTPLWELFDEIEPTIAELEASGGTGWQGQKLINLVNNALDVADKGLEHGESSGSVAALKAFVAIQNAGLEAKIDDLTERIKQLENEE